MEMMKCDVFYGKDDMRTEHRPIPTPGPKEVLIKVMACGVCGSDVHIFHGDQGSTSTVPPLIQGHEFAGIVTQTGAEVTSCRAGDHVSVDPADNCNECWYCMNGLMSHCEHMRAIGTNADGGFSQYCVVPARLVHQLAEDVSFVEGAMVEPLACCINGIDRSDIKAGDNVVVYGGGAIGLLLMQLAKSRGAARVILVEPEETKREMALKLGASFTIDPIHEKVPEVLKKKGIDHVQSVIETCGLKSTSEEAMDIVDRHGTVVLFAVTAVDNVIGLKTYNLFQREITVKGSFCSPYDIGRAVEMINGHAIDVTSMLAGQESLEKLPGILADPKIRAKGKYIILPNGSELL
ncbi:MAG: zinc-dependent alcohol dehydrogenase family protein [Lachnospiraceae bacterium]|nr:zinc-dependent alcohol dehydrogenase family protein [Lachnospiraceae bacterium]